MYVSIDVHTYVHILFCTIVFIFSSEIYSEKMWYWTTNHNPAQIYSSPHLTFYILISFLSFYIYLYRFLTHCTKKKVTTIARPCLGNPRTGVVSRRMCTTPNRSCAMGMSMRPLVYPPGPLIQKPIRCKRGHRHLYWWWIEVDVPLWRRYGLRLTNLFGCRSRVTWIIPLIFPYFYAIIGS